MEEEGLTQEDKKKVEGTFKVAIKYGNWTLLGIVLGIILFILKAAIFN